MKILIKKEHGWYCSECDAVYFNPDEDSEHEELHQSIDVIGYEWLKQWLRDAYDFGLNPEEIIYAIDQNDFKIE